MTDYIGYLNRDKMKLITVDLVSKKPPSRWDNYLYWTQIIHGHQADDADIEKSKFKPSQDDFQGEKPFMISPDGKIRVYEANSPQQCIILGRGQTFCISQPGNRMWQSYRDNQNSTFYFAYDDTRDDRLSIVVIDVRHNGIVLTDRPNKTGTTLDPYTGELTNDSKPYMKYLKEKGIDTSKLVNIPKNPKEKEEHEKLGRVKTDLDWFIALSPDYKSKYIGRAHLLTDEQFDHLWENKFNSLLTQYVKTGLKLNDHQIDKIAKDRDLRDNYIHNRSIADQHSGNLSNKEYSLFSVKQKESYYNNMNDDKKLDKAIKFDDLDFYKYLVEKGLKIDDDAVEKAAETGNLELVKYLIENGAKINDNAFRYLVSIGDLDYLKHIINEKGVKINDNAVYYATKTGNLDLVKYLVDEKGKEITDTSIRSAVRSGNLALVKYIADEKGFKIINYDIMNSAISSGNSALVKYLVDEKGLRLFNDPVGYAALGGHLDIIRYLVDEKGEKIPNNAVNYAANGGNLALIKYLADEKGSKINPNLVHIPLQKNNLDIIKYLVDEKGLRLPLYAAHQSAQFGYLDLVKYLVEEKGFKVTDKEIEVAEINGHDDMVDYLNSVKERQ